LVLGIAADAQQIRLAWGCVATVDTHGRTIFVAAAHRDDDKRYVVHGDEKLTAFLELETSVNRLASNLKRHHN
jgi:hypothetical protein